MTTFENFDFDHHDSSDVATGLQEALEESRTGGDSTYSDRKYHVHYWRTNSGRILDDVELKGDENIQSEEVYEVDREHHPPPHDRMRYLPCRFSTTRALLVLTAAVAVIVALMLMPISISQSIPRTTNDESFFVMRLSAGATKAYTDPRGMLWIPDNEKNGDENDDSFKIIGESMVYKYPSNVTIANADPFGEGLYHSERLFEGDESNDAEQQQGYEIIVPKEGVYETSLHFTEAFFQDIGKRVMDVYVEGELLQGDFDIFKHAGGGFTATVLSCQRAVSDGALSIQLVSKKDKAKINGLEVTYVADF